MTPTDETKSSVSLQQQASNCFASYQYAQAIEIYEQLIQNEPQTIDHYWYLGLAYLLQHREEEAQSTWLFTLAQAPPEQGEKWTAELINILKCEAIRQFELQRLDNSWLIRKYLYELDSKNLENLLHLTQLEIELHTFSVESLEQLQLARILQQTKPNAVRSELLLSCLSKLLNYPVAEVLRFAQSCLLYVQDKRQWVEAILASEASLRKADSYFLEALFDFSQSAEIEDLSFWQVLSKLGQDQGYFQLSIDSAREFLKHAETKPSQLLGNYLLFGVLTRAGRWQELEDCLEQYQRLMTEILDSDFQEKNFAVVTCLSVAPSLLQYYQDNCSENRYFQNTLSRLAQENIQAYKPIRLNSGFQKRHEGLSGPLKIGFIGHTLRAHSVGWLFRWFYKYIDRELFHIHLYLVNQNPNDIFARQWFSNPSDYIQNVQDDEAAIAEKIYDDQVDILIDLDSNSSSITNVVMAFRPSPVQVTWLGFDASGIPAIDYFIADPYVLSDTAAAHYQEKIWRLPQTYLAIDGFEVDVPTLSRNHLGIPSDAVIYLSAQSGYKRHPETICLQMQILKDVPNSYFLIKGGGDQKQVQQLFISAADEIGINPDRLRFLERDSNEFIHRANLQIADVILDTYPYNGATTTLEAMWMGIPLVTRVGEQFAARNSYTFLRNAGITDGIAWTNKEYVEWGIRLGREPNLRSKVAWQLALSRQTSPLWNTKRFTRQMETAYQHMWQIYKRQST